MNGHLTEPSTSLISFRCRLGFHRPQMRWAEPHGPYSSPCLRCGRRIVTDAGGCAAGQTHELKCVPPFFDAVLDGSKPFEVRKHDRPFAEGDTLHLREFWDGAYTGRECHRTVTYVLCGGEFGVERGHVVMGIAG